MTVSHGKDIIENIRAKSILQVQKSLNICVDYVTRRYVALKFFPNQRFLTSYLSNVTLR